MQRLSYNEREKPEQTDTSSSAQQHAALNPLKAPTTSSKEVESRDDQQYRRSKMRLPTSKLGRTQQVRLTAERDRNNSSQDRDKAIVQRSNKVEKQGSAADMCYSLHRVMSQIVLRCCE